MIYSGRNVFTLLIMIMMILFIFLSIGYNPKARLIPLIVANSVLIMSILLFLTDSFPTIRKRLSFIQQQAVFSSDDVKSKFGVKEKASEVSWRNVFHIFLWLSLVIVLLYFTHYLICGLPFSHSFYEVLCKGQTFICHLYFAKCRNIYVYFI